MPQYQFNVYGINRVRNSLRALVSAHKDILDPVVRAWSQETRKFLKRPYPAPPPESSYRRTGRLGSSFAVERKGVAHYRIVNAANAGKGAYASYVIGDEDGDFRQARVHKQTGWYRMKDEIETKLPDLRAAIEKALENA